MSDSHREYNDKEFEDSNNKNNKILLTNKNNQISGSYQDIFIKEINRLVKEWHNDNEGMNIMEYIFTIFVFTLCFCGVLILFLLLAVLNPQF